MYDYKYLNGPILAGSYQNWVIQSALAPLRGLEARENWVYWILTILNYKYVTMTIVHYQRIDVLIILSRPL